MDRLDRNITNRKMLAIAFPKRLILLGKPATLPELKIGRIGV
jgi:hypothetical protein